MELEIATYYVSISHHLSCENLKTTSSMIYSSLLLVNLAIDVTHLSEKSYYKIIRLRIGVQKE